MALFSSLYLLGITGHSWQSNRAYQQHWVSVWKTVSSKRRQRRDGNVICSALLSGT